MKIPHSRGLVLTTLSLLGMTVFAHWPLPLRMNLSYAEMPVFEAMSGNPRQRLGPSPLG